ERPVDAGIDGRAVLEAELHALRAVGDEPRHGEDGLRATDGESAGCVPGDRVADLRDQRGPDRAKGADGLLGGVLVRRRQVDPRGWLLRLVDAELLRRDEAGARVVVEDAIPVTFGHGP